MELIILFTSVNINQPYSRIQQVVKVDHIVR